jgi:hypothetical protein
MSISSRPEMGQAIEEMSSHNIILFEALSNAAIDAKIVELGERVDEVVSSLLTKEELKNPTTIENAKQRFLGLMVSRMALSHSAKVHFVAHKIALSLIPPGMYQEMALRFSRHVIPLQLMRGVFNQPLKNS